LSYCRAKASGSISILSPAKKPKNFTGFEKKTVSFSRSRLKSRIFYRYYRGISLAEFVDGKMSQTRSTEIEGRESDEKNILGGAAYRGVSWGHGYSPGDIP
jgi:hypothetical protein